MMRHAIALSLLCSFSANAAADPLPSTASNTSAVEPSPRERARHWFSTGLSLARAGRYTAAKALFLEAYAAEPHYLVLYNIAQAELQLQELAAAATHLRLYLSEGGPDISVKTRQAVQAQIERIEARQEPANGGAVATGAPSVDPRELSVTNERQGSKSLGSSGVRVPQGAAPSNNSVDSRSPGDPGDAGSHFWGYVLTSGGFGILGAGLGLYVWNDGRYDGWKDERATLIEQRTGTGSSGNEAARLGARARENDALLASVQAFDIVPIVLVGVGLGVMGSGIWTLTSPMKTQFHVSGDTSRLNVTTRWVW
jgi:hypothetical protein